MQCKLSSITEWSRFIQTHNQVLSDAEVTCVIETTITKYLR
jgi:hypothetical protein